MTYKYIFGPVPSRRLGQSLGISPIPYSTCNYSCIYCQLGRTRNMTNKIKDFFPLEDIIDEFKDFLKSEANFDVVSIVGEGEPTLYADLENLIKEIKKLTQKPVAVITNGSFLSEERVLKALSQADIVLPSLDGWDQVSFKKINRPHGQLVYDKVLQGLKDFSKSYKGQLWLEIMLMKDINDKPEDIASYKKMLQDIDYDRLYINTPVRPPAEAEVQEVSPETIELAVKELGGISIEFLNTGNFFGQMDDPKETVINIIKRHPMNQKELASFFPEELIEELKNDPRLEHKEYKGYLTFRYKGKGDN
jgi:wyosine [tRNA(Phe)-imidazoG37] synthetase (radical SAM superfamily)